MLLICFYITLHRFAHSVEFFRLRQVRFKAGFPKSAWLGASVDLPVSACVDFPEQ